MAKYVIQRYQRYPIFEPAEGGYYYEGREPDVHPYEKFDTKQEASEALKKLVKKENESLTEIDDGRGDSNEGYLVISPNGVNAYSINHKYISDGYDFYVEPINRRGRHRKGRVSYC